MFCVSKPTLNNFSLIGEGFKKLKKDGLHFSNNGQEIISNHQNLAICSNMHFRQLVTKPNIYLHYLSPSMALTFDELLSFLYCKSETL